MSERPRLDRRTAVASLGLGALGVGVVGATVGPRVVTALGGGDALVGHGPGDAVEAAAGAQPLPMPAPNREIERLFAGLVPGGMVSTHWRLESFHGLREGAVPVVMSTVEGERFALEIFRDTTRGAEPIARGEGLAFCLVNHGDGDDPTSEAAGLGVRALAQELAANRRAGAPIPSGMTTQPERMRREPDGMYDVPV